MPSTAQALLFAAAFASNCASANDTISIPTEEFKKACNQIAITGDNAISRACKQLGEIKSQTAVESKKPAYPVFKEPYIWQRSIKLADPNNPKP